MATKPVYPKLIEAADYIEKHGWTRGSFVRHGRVCALQAMSKVQVGWEVEDIFRDVVGSTITQWNDEQKSRKPVIDTLRRVAMTGK